MATGNIHINVVAEAYDPKIEAVLEPYIYELVGTSPLLLRSKLLTSKYCSASHRGSISAEHGIGSMKPQHLHFSKDAVSIALMQRIKSLLDERGIMNPGKVVPVASI